MPGRIPIRVARFLVLLLCASTLQGAYLKGDISGDCRVGFEDVRALAANWLAGSASEADIVGDGDGVNMADFAALAANWARSIAPVIINEIHYDPDVKTELVEYVELYNRSTMDVNIARWHFSSGIEYTFPQEMVLPAGQYILVAQTPSQVQSKFSVPAEKVLGPWIGKLRNEGETICLRDADGGKVDEVDYKLGFPWPTVGGPPGHSIELVNPAFDNDLGGNWRPSEPESAPAPTTLIPSGAAWKYRKGTSEPSSPSDAWRQVGFDDSSWAQGNLFIGYGESFIATDLADMPGNYSSVYLRKTFEVDDPAAVGALKLSLIYDDGFNAYINGYFVRGENVGGTDLPCNATANRAIEDKNWHSFDLSGPEAYLKNGTNVIAIHLLNASLSGSSDCFLDVRLEASSASFGPSPGRRNTSYAENIGPQVRQVKHRPKQPKSGQDVTITAKVTDPEAVESVVLYYQPVDPGAYIELTDPQYETNWLIEPMRDDGAGGDEQAGDNIYTVVLDGSVQVHRRLVRYRIGARDCTGLSVICPYRYDYETEPVPNFAYFVYDGVPDWYGAVQPGVTPTVCYPSEVLTRIPVYHLISKKESVEHCMWIDKYGGDLYKWYGTLVYDGQVYDHIRYRARGGVWRYAMGKNMWKFDFNRGQSFQARDDFGRKYDTKWDKLNFSACIQQGNYWHRGEQGMFEAAGFKLFNLMGVEAPKTSWVHFRVIDEASEAGPTQYDGDFWGLYMTIEQMDGRFLDEHKLPDGNLYKIEGHNAEMNNQGPTAVTDKSDFAAFKSAYYYDPNPTEQWWRTNVDLQRYYSYRCVVEGIHHGDIGYGKNYFFYLHPQQNIWYMLPWDLDLTWANNMYGNGEDPFKKQGAIFSNPGILVEYQNRLREFHDLLYNPEQMNALLDELADVIDSPADGPSMVDADRAMWDYNPIMTSSYVNLSKAGVGRFYAGNPSAGIYVPSPGGFRGMVQLMKNYIVSDNKEFDTYTEDPCIPETPLISYIGPPGYPVNNLLFRTSQFSDPQGRRTFEGMKWRIAEVTDPNNPRYDPNEPRKYEIEAVWDSGELTSFQYDIRIPAAVVKPGRTYRVRCRMKDATGRWSHWSAPVQFIAGEPVSAGILDSLRITELMYNPAAADVSAGELDVDNDEFEFVELKNIGDQPLDLAYVSFVRGVTFDFAGSSVASLGPGQFVLVVRNKAAFESRYGTSLSSRIAGQYIDNADRLSNGGETIQLVDMWNGTIAEFTYDDGRGWPLSADGSGHSLVPLDSAIASESSGSLNYGGNWRSSAYIGGSPGADDPLLPRTVVLNEVMAHTDYSDRSHPEYDSNDWIELYNASGLPITLGGWYLSDDREQLRKWAIPLVGILDYGYLSFDEVSGFHNPIESGFGLNKAGEEVILSYLPGTGKGRVVDYVRFEGEQNNASLGRYPDGGDYWFHQVPSRGSSNGPGVMDIVIDELMYHPADGNEEYVELYNPTSVRINLANSAGGWRLDGAVDYVFGSGMYLEPGGRLLVVGFDPVVEPGRLARFVSSYGVGDLAAGIEIIGPWDGDLSNSGERLALKRPQAADVVGEPVSWVIVDEVIYADVFPWPVAADGDGFSLQRNCSDGSRSGNDPVNWRAEVPSPGGSP